MAGGMYEHLALGATVTTSRAENAVRREAKRNGSDGMCRILFQNILK
jgi:hypothetical protein